MDREFNLIDEPWICVRDNGCEVKEISIRQVFEHAQDYTELAGETKTQDMCVKSNMVYTLCKHMVYMLSITNEHKK